LHGLIIPNKFMNSTEIEELTTRVNQGHELSEGEISVVVSSLVSEKIPDELKELFLKSLARRGESPDEFSCLVERFRNLAVDPEIGDLSKEAIDLCGTGGDKSGSFNISTAVSFILAAADVCVIKHGNRSISSKCGSADLIEACGIPLHTNQATRRECLKRFNFCFLFAPEFHPAFKAIVSVRKKLAQQGVISVFNRLGPTLNPACPPYQLLGVYDSQYQRQISHALAKNGGAGGCVVHGKIKGETSGVDELTSCGTNYILGYGNHSTTDALQWNPSEWNQELHPIEDLKGGGIQDNLNLMMSLADGDCKGGLLATILINAASALKISGRVSSLHSGVELAEVILRDGKLKMWLSQVAEFFKK
jgi:anthranilate phosphoribosyltransferase